MHPSKRCVERHQFPTNVCELGLRKARETSKAGGGDPCGYSALNLMAQEAALIFSLAFEVRELYELKALNKSKVKSLTDAVDQICEYLQTHYSLIVAECPGHLIRLEGHVRAASDWCKRAT